MNKDQPHNDKKSNKNISSQASDQLDNREISNTNSYSILGKRSSKNIANFKKSIDNDSRNRAKSYGDEEEDEDKKLKRLIQNRKSAQKCRIKKKIESMNIKEQLIQTQNENKDLKEKLNEVTMMLFKKIEDNQHLSKCLEQNQMQHTIFLTKLLLNQEISSQQGTTQQNETQSTQSLIKNYLMQNSQISKQNIVKQDSKNQQEIQNSNMKQMFLQQLLQNSQDVKFTQNSVANISTNDFSQNNQNHKLIQGQKINEYVQNLQDIRFDEKMTQNIENENDMYFQNLRKMANPQKTPLIAPNKPGLIADIGNMNESVIGGSQQVSHSNSPMIAQNKVIQSHILNDNSHSKNLMYKYQNNELNELIKKVQMQKSNIQKQAGESQPKQNVLHQNFSFTENNFQIN